jgi:alkylhydroperoxidase family enzyme
MGVLEGALGVAREVTDRALLDLVGARVAMLIGHEEAVPLVLRAGSESSGALADWPSDPRFTQRERDCLGFVEQYVMDVGRVDDEMVGRAARHFADGEFWDFTVALYLTEFALRLDLAATGLLLDADHDSSPPRAAAGSRSAEGPRVATVAANGSLGITARTPRVSRDAANPRLAAAVAAFHSAVLACRELDVVTTELVRLRGARLHDCRTCQAVRLDEAAQAGVDASLTERVDHFEASDLPDRVKAALRVVDWLVTRPDPDDIRVVGPACAYLQPAERADLCLHICRNSYQKALVALGHDGIDPAVLNDAGIAYYGYRPDGSRKPFSPAVADV